MQSSVTSRAFLGTRSTLAILLMLTVLATACASRAASAGSAQATSTSAASSQPVIVQMNDANRCFVPATLTVPVGTTVTWQNVGQVTHTVTFDPSKAIRASDVSLPSGVAPWDSGNVDGGQSYSYTFTTPGTYHYVCIPHEALGMLATITVTN